MLAFLLSSIITEAGDDEDSDDDIEIGAQQHDFRCPLTLKLLTEPMTSYVSSHYLAFVVLTRCSPSSL